MHGVAICRRNGVKPLAIALAALAGLGLSTTILAFGISSGSPGRTKPVQPQPRVSGFGLPGHYAYPYSVPYPSQQRPTVKRRRDRAQPGAGSRAPRRQLQPYTVTPIPSSAAPRISPNTLVQRREQEMRQREAFLEMQIESKRNALYDYYFGRPNPYLRRHPNTGAGTPYN